jgi:hypothetical protein
MCSCMVLALCPQPKAIRPETPNVQRPFAPNGLSCPLPPRYSGLLRQSERLRWFSRRAVIPPVCARLDGPSGRPDLPCFTFDIPSLRAITPTPRGGLSARTRFPFPQSHGFPQGSSRSVPPGFPTSVSVGGSITALQCSLYATARLVACPPVPI